MCVFVCSLLLSIIYLVHLSPRWLNRFGQTWAQLKALQVPLFKFKWIMADTSGFGDITVPFNTPPPGRWRRRASPLAYKSWVGVLLLDVFRLGLYLIIFLVLLFLLWFFPFCRWQRQKGKDYMWCNSLERVEILSRWCEMNLGMSFFFYSLIPFFFIEYLSDDDLGLSILCLLRLLSTCFFFEKFSTSPLLFSYFR